jgi:hypothetical protein
MNSMIAKRCWAIGLVVAAVFLGGEKPANGACYGCVQVSQGCCGGVPDGSPNGDNLCYQGGTLVTQPKIYISKWNLPAPPYDDPKGVFPLIEAFLGGLNGTSGGIGGSQYLNMVTQYFTANPIGILKGNDFVDTSGFSNPPTPAQVQQAIKNAAEHYHVTGDPDAVILLLTGTNRYTSCIGGICFRICGARHDSVPYPGQQNIAYIDLPYTWDLNGGAGCLDLVNGNGKYDIGPALLHELTETMTDPRYGPYPCGSGTAGWLDDCGCEVADKCGNLAAFPTRWAGLQNTGVADTSSFQVAAIWSNLLGTVPPGGCVYARPTDENAVYRGNNGLWFKKNAGSWVDWGNGGVALTSSPCASAWGYNKLDFFGLGSTGVVRHAYSGNDGATPPGWNDWGAAPSPYTFVGPPDAASWGPGRVDIVELGIRSNPTGYEIFHRYYDNGYFSAWQWWGGGSGALSNAAIASSRLTKTQNSHRVDVAVITSGLLLHGVSADGSSTPGYENLGNGGYTFVTGGNPDIATWGAIDPSSQGRIDIVVASSSLQIIHFWCQTSASTGLCSGTLHWDPMGNAGGGVTLWEPSIAQAGDYRLVVSAHGSDENIWRRSQDGPVGWAPNWQNYGRGSYYPVGGPDVAIW